MNAQTCLAIVSILLILSVEQVQVTKAVTCNPMQLSPCATAITSPSKPSKVCCAKLKEQRPCLCRYVKNPYLQKLIKSPRAKIVAAFCGTRYPRC
ncbi:Bifunctional inhibitor/lipid-transfer protein/seed storage 2S albumin superfamily protein [Striga hermonthica]|uniref:Bifunctional inhibitor/lipid-transfer protein/seed storage 2S albumin superfamily protein n=1 Tax=Striga hermonthica TaxID=68872 RepID=A0A9N7R7M6_STRHE|nr:Bifunctional inhibitor/lipid-transfer protein/seed storage 2S albumin superfamily protein [Striga hermonthica]